MRPALPLLALFALAACGSKTGEPSMLQSAATALRGNDHTCAAPVASGSPEQVACHEAAAKSCPDGTSPDRVDFSEEVPGQFMVKGYSCV